MASAAERISAEILDSSELAWEEHLHEAHALRSRLFAHAHAVRVETPLGGSARPAQRSHRCRQARWPAVEGEWPVNSRYYKLTACSCHRAPGASCRETAREQKPVLLSGITRIAIWSESAQYNGPNGRAQLTQIRSQSQTLSPQSLLALPIEQLMLERGIVGDDDMIRGFFRAQVSLGICSSIGLNDSAGSASRQAARAGLGHFAKRAAVFDGETGCCDVDTGG